MKNWFWNETDEQETLERKLETEELESSNKIKEYILEIESIKDEAKREVLIIEKKIRLEKIGEIKTHIREMRIRIMFYERHQ